MSEWAEEEKEEEGGHKLARSREDITATPVKAFECPGSAPETVHLEGSGTAYLCAFELVMTT